MTNKYFISFLAKGGVRGRASFTTEEPIADMSGIERAEKMIEKDLCLEEVIVIFYKEFARKELT